MKLTYGGLALGLVFLASCMAERRKGYDPAGPTPPGFGSPGCVGLSCNQAVCASGSTTLRGTVYDPARKNPLYNVMVYVPRTIDPLPEMKRGISCDRCASLVLSPLTSAVTNERGEFVLSNVPVGDKIPVVAQVGKWRRRIEVNVAKSCAENVIPEYELSLPRNGSEGDMPQIAVTTGALDSLECLMQGIGVDEREFVPGGDRSGHIHMFDGYGGHGVAGSPRAKDALWDSVISMSAYDIVALSCEGAEHNEEKPDKSVVAEYANAGGRVFGTHYHYTWFKNSPDPLVSRSIDWDPVYDEGGDGIYTVDTSFPKGSALADWLVNVRASSVRGEIALTGVTNSMSSVREPAQSWIARTSDAVRYFSLNTPAGALEDTMCGRIVFGDLHLMGSGGRTFPNGCPGAGRLSPQQAALEFFFFDLAACVSADDAMPTPPK